MLRLPARACIRIGFLHGRPQTGPIYSPSAGIQDSSLENAGSPLYNALDWAQEENTTKPAAFAYDTPDSVKGRHLLRGILRECSYLPDSHAQDWTRRHVLHRFREYGFKVWQHRDDSNFSERLKAKQYEAKQAYHKLQRATEGEMKPLRTILFMAYGRIGKRRRELVSKLLPKRAADELLEEEKDVSEALGDDAVDHDTAELDIAAPARQPTANPKQKGMANAKLENPYIPEMTPQLRALAISQIQHPPPHITRPVLRRMEPIIPELNTWLRPMPKCRVKNMTKKWYAEFLDKIHPPLPTKEWERLRQLADGSMVEDIPRRRTRTGQQAKKKNKSALDVLLQSPVINSARVYANAEAHTVTPRLMRRLWAQVFEQCPRIDLDGARKNWRVTWGAHALHALQVPCATEPNVEP